MPTGDLHPVQRPYNPFLDPFVNEARRARGGVTDEDVERIARRVVELLMEDEMPKGGNWRDTNTSKPKLAIKMSSADKKAMDKAMRDKGEKKT